MQEMLAAPRTFTEWRSFAAERRFDAVFILYLAALTFSFFFLDTQWQRNLFYVGLPLCFWAGIKYPPRALNTVAVVLITGLAAYLLINVASIGWSSDKMDLEKFIQRSKMLVILPVFMVGFVAFLLRYGWAWDVMIKAFIAGAFISAPLLVLFNIDHIMDGSRLNGWGKAENRVQCGVLYGLALLMAMAHIQAIQNFFRSLNWQPLLAACTVCAIIALPFFLSYSRGPILAVAAVCGAMALLKGMSDRRWLIPLGFVIASGIVILLLNDSILERGSNGRMQVWDQAIDIFMAKPWFGQGIASKFYYRIISVDGDPGIISHPHSIYLSALVHTGIVGLTVLLGSLLSGLYFAKKALCAGQASYFILIAFGAVLGFLDYGGYYTNFGGTWLVYWLPMAGLAAYWQTHRT